jgi:hypothetical protein
MTDRSDQRTRHAVSSSSCRLTRALISPTRHASISRKIDRLIGDSTDVVLRTSMGAISHLFADTGAAVAGLQILRLWMNTMTAAGANIMSQRFSFRDTLRATRDRRPGLLILAVVVGVAYCTAPARARAAETAEETWHVYRMAGKDMGHIRQVVRRKGNEVMTTVETLIVINRLGSRMEIKKSDNFTETTDGQLRSVHSTMSTSRQSTTLEASVEPSPAERGHVAGGKVVLRASTGGKEYRRELPYSGALIGPWGIRQEAVRGLKKAGDIATYQTFVPELQRVTKVTQKLLEANVALETSGTKTICARVEERMEGRPGVPTWLDDAGRMLRQTHPSPTGQIEVVVADRATALQAVGAVLPNEVVAQSLLPANVRLPAPRSLERLVVRLRKKDPTLDWPDFAAAGQTVLRHDEEELLLEVKQLTAEQREIISMKPGKSLREYLEPNAILQSDDAEVRRIAREVAGNEKDAFRAACRLRDWVKNNMHRDFGIGIAPASEAIRQRKGTCGAYAVALASLARAAGIPSRVVMGYAYIYGIWGGHAWVEVSIGGRWVPIDGAAPSPGPADAARIAFGQSSFAEGEGPLESALSRIFGNVQVIIVEFEAGGTLVKVPAGAEAFTIEGNTYRNPWLGLEVQKPAGFRFTKTDAIYPDSTVVAIEDPAGRRVCVRQLALPDPTNTESMKQVFHRLEIGGKAEGEDIAGRQAFVAEEGAKAGLAFAAGADLWVLTAEGDHAGQRIRRAAAMLTIRRQVQ